MGLFSIAKMFVNEKKKTNRYLEMSSVDLNELNDQELYEAVSMRMLAEEGNKYVDEFLNTLSGAKRAFYVVNYYEMEVNNGGLCQYFVNSSRTTAPYLIDSLLEIGAKKQVQLLTNFLSNNDIKLTELDSFIINDVEEFEAQNERYLFDDFDEAFYHLYEEESLTDCLITYVRRNIEAF